MASVLAALLSGCASAKSQPASTQHAEHASRPGGTEKQEQEGQTALPPEAEEFLRTLSGALDGMRSEHSAPRLVDASSTEDLQARLAEMVALDQYSRESSVQMFELALTPAQQERLINDFATLVMTFDREHTAELKEYVAAKGWPSRSEVGQEAADNAWLIAQHSDHDRAFQRDVLERMELLLEEDEVSGSNFAYLYDRVAVGTDQPQRFGTQGECVGGTWEARPLEDLDTIDVRRAAVGLEPFEKYKQGFVEICRGASAP